MSYHIPILTNEIIDNLIKNNKGIYIDCTVGFGGHIEKISNCVSGKIIGLDLDPYALNMAKKKLSRKENIIFYNESFLNFPDILDELNIDKVDGFLFDLGISSYQVDSKHRGFSYRTNGPLDMRFGYGKTNLTAQHILNYYNEKQISKILKEYGEERYYRKITKQIISYRKSKQIKTTFELKEIIFKAIPYQNVKVLSRVFQSIRIAVNNEINIIKETLIKTIDYLKIGGRIAVISFHSIEDRIIKHFFKDQIIVFDNYQKKFSNQIKFNVITKKPILPTKIEILNNNRASSAKLRIAERIA